MIVTTDGIVLRTMKYRDTSQIVTLFSRDYGKISVVAKGIRNRLKGGAGGLDPMAIVRAVVYRKPGRELHLMSQCDRIRVFKGLDADLGRMAGGMAAVELTHLALPPEEPHPDVFLLLERTLDHLGGATRDPAIALYYYKVQLLGILGFRPVLKECSHCGRTLEDIGRSGGIRSSIGPHGLVCPACGPGAQAVSLATIAALGGLQDAADHAVAMRIVLSAPVSAEVDAVLRMLVMQHLTGMKPLRSEQIFGDLG